MTAAIREVWAESADRLSRIEVRNTNIPKRIKLTKRAAVPSHKPKLLVLEKIMTSINITARVIIERRIRAILKELSEKLREEKISEIPVFCSSFGKLIISGEEVSIKLTTVSFRLFAVSASSFLKVSKLLSMILTIAEDTSCFDKEPATAFSNRSDSVSGRYSETAFSDKIMVFWLPEICSSSGTTRYFYSEVYKYFVLYLLYFF